MGGEPSSANYGAKPRNGANPLDTIRITQWSQFRTGHNLRRFPSNAAREMVETVRYVLTESRHFGNSTLKGYVQGKKCNSL